MSDVIISKRYAQALMDEASEHGLTERIDADMALLRDSLAGSKALRGFFDSPVIPREKKASIVRTFFDGKVSDTTLRFLLLMVEKHRENMFSLVGKAYAELRDQQLGIVNVSARIARPMQEDEEKRLREVIEEMVGKRVRLETHLDATLLGGVIVRIGDTLYDGSISNQLKSLRERLESGRHATNHG